jgi:hypothetical protein
LNVTELILSDKSLTFEFTVRPSAEFGTHSGLLGTGPDGGIAAVSSNLQFDLLLELVDHLWPSVDQALPA